MPEPPIRVLLVDDDEDDYVTVGELLGDGGKNRFELSLAPDFDRGLEAILSSNYQACLLDYRLGSRSGLDFLGEVAARSNHTPIIVLTGAGDRDVDLAAAKAGAADYLVKAELTGALLERSIRYAMERARTLAYHRDAREAAERLNLAKSSFLATVSHEIRTPMNAILGMAEILSESSLDEEQRGYVDVFRRSGSELMSLINDLLDLSKIESGRLELENIEFHLEELIEEVLELTASKAREKALCMVLRSQPGLPDYLRGDSHRLRQVLLNLLGNAVKFTHSGEIVLSVGNGGLPGSGCIEFAVSDTGIGIPAAKIDTIFEDFKQADAATTRKYGGTGLGLGISRKLVQQMGGQLTAASEPGRGSTFRFTAKFEVPAGKRQTGPGKEFQGRNGLVLDGDPGSRPILLELLASWGMNCQVFGVAEEALANLQTKVLAGEDYDIAIVNWPMDRKTGFDLAQLIRSIAPRTPVVMLSADAEPRGCWEREDAGLEGYAIKPVRRSHLFQAMRDAMGIGRGRRSAHGPQAGPQAGSQEPTPATAAKRRGMRILVAEDAMNNRLLIRAFLKGSPHELIFAEDGQSAVNVFRREIFGLILMDIRMPVMDGLSAAKAIRDFERVEGRGATPILALSADASPADVNRSVAAGCQLHLSKPISKSRLLAAIDDFSAQPAKGGSSAGLGKAEETDAEDIGLDESIRELVPQYLRNCREALATIPGRIKSCDFEGIRSIGHNLKGTGTGYGFPEVTRLGAAMEFAAKQNQPEAVLRNAADLQSLMVGAESSRQLVYAE